MNFLVRSVVILFLAAIVPATSAAPISFLFPSTDGLVGATTSLTNQFPGVGGNPTVTMHVASMTSGHQLYREFNGMGLVGSNPSEHNGLDNYGPGTEAIRIRFDTDLFIENIQFGQWDANDDVNILGLPGGDILYHANPNNVTINQYLPAFTWITFSVGKESLFESPNDEFYLRRISAQTVPVPAAGWLFISAIAGLLGRKRLVRK